MSGLSRMILIDSTGVITLVALEYRLVFTFLILNLIRFAQIYLITLTFALLRSHQILQRKTKSFFTPPLFAQCFLQATSESQ